MLLTQVLLRVKGNEGFLTEGFEYFSTFLVFLVGIFFVYLLLYIKIIYMKSKLYCTTDLLGSFFSKLLFRYFFFWHIFGIFIFKRFIDFCSVD